MSATVDDQLLFAGPEALAAMVRAREVKPRELAELSLSRIEALDPQLNAFRTVMAEEALAEADARDGHEGPLAGVPIAVKDEHAVAGQPVTKGSRGHRPPQPADSELVHRLRAAGAVVIGITNAPELTIWPWTVSEANGVTRNPWDVSRTPGGSSGGSAAALAAGMVAAATAADGGGSIRLPSANCGLVGMKPTRGRVSMAPIRQGWFGLAGNGALARTVTDSALLLDVIHGATPSDADQAPPFEGSYRQAAGRPPTRLRIALSRKMPPPLLAKLSPDQRRAWERTGALLGELGHEVVERDPDYGLAALEFTQVWMRAVYEESLGVPDRTVLEGLTKEIATMGRVFVPPRRRDKLLAARAHTTARILALWDEVDVLLTPGSPSTAIRAEGGFGSHAPLAIDRAGRTILYMPVFNLTGQPALVIPAGIGSDGLPLSVQLVGRPGDEDVLYALGAQIEAAQPWADRRPALAAV